MENASSLKVSKDKLFLGHEKFKALSLLKLQELTYVVHQLLDDSGRYFSKNCGKQIPSVCISHDIWESKTGHWLGISLFIMDVNNWVNVRLPIGFKKCNCKKSLAIAEQVEQTMQLSTLRIYPSSFYIILLLNLLQSDLI